MISQEYSGFLRFLGFQGCQEFEYFMDQSRSIEFLESLASLNYVESLKCVESL